MWRGTFWYMYDLVIIIVTEYLPEVEYIITTREKKLKKRLLADMPRRTSDRIAFKSALKEEEVSLYFCH